MTTRLPLKVVCKVCGSSIFRDYVICPYCDKPSDGTLQHNDIMKSQGLVTKECEWEYQDEEEGYDTKCGQFFILFGRDTLSGRKNFKYCPYCGKAIKEMEYYDPSYEGLIPEEEE